MVRLVLMMLVAAGYALAPQQETNEGDQPSADQPESQPAVRTLPRNPRQAQIFEALLGDTQRPRGPTILSQEPGSSGELPEGSASLFLEGTRLSERPGRVVRSDGQSLFHFKPGSISEGAPDVIEFNKNGLLEAMEAEADAGVMEFIISAEVTRYRDRNYLNLLKYRRQVSHGNLSP
jgi:hypothetical protein